MELGGLEDVGELREFEVVDLAELEGAERGVEEVFEEFACELGVRRRRRKSGRRRTLTPALSLGEREGGLCAFGWLIVRVHPRMFAHRRDGTRGKLRRTRCLRTGGVRRDFLTPPTACLDS